MAAAPRARLRVKVPTAKAATGSCREPHDGDEQRRVGQDHFDGARPQIIEALSLAKQRRSQQHERECDEHPTLWHPTAARGGLRFAHGSPLL